MSRFWAAGSASDSDSESSSGSSAYSSEDNAVKTDNRWVAMSDSDSSDDEVRVVKSGKERALEAFQLHIKNLRAAMKERDYYQIQTEFDDLAKAMIKAKQYLAEGVPRPLVKILVDLEDYIAERLQDKAQFKKLSARQGRALNRMKLTLRKHNKAYQVVMEAYRANPMSDEEEEEASSSSSSDSDSDSDASDKSSAKSSKASSGSGSDSDSESGSVRCLPHCVFVHRVCHKDAHFHRE